MVPVWLGFDKPEPLPPPSKITFPPRTCLYLGMHKPSLGRRTLVAWGAQEAFLVTWSR